MGIDDLIGNIHGFSDPNSNSGYLVTASLLAERKLRPDQFFRQANRVVIVEDTYFV